MYARILRERPESFFWGKFKTGALLWGDIFFDMEPERDSKTLDHISLLHLPFLSILLEVHLGDFYRVRGIKCVPFLVSPSSSLLPRPMFSLMRASLGYINF
jgi:hypothetical protein